MQLQMMNQQTKALAGVQPLTLSGGLLKEEITTILAKMRYLHQIDQEIKVHLLEQSNFQKMF